MVTCYNMALLTDLQREWALLTDLQRERADGLLGFGPAGDELLQASSTDVAETRLSLKR